MSNVVPQNAGMDGSIWRRLENLVRRLAAEADSVIVVTGAIFPVNAERIGAGGVAVPAELYKVVLIRNGSQSRLFAVMMPNAEAGGQSLDSFVVPVAEVEKRSGSRFFAGLEAGR